MATNSVQSRLAAMRQRIAAIDPLAARLIALNDRTGKSYGTAVKRGRWRGYEGAGKHCKPVTEWHDTRAECIAAIEAREA